MRWHCRAGLTLPQMAQMRSADRVQKCLLFGVDRTYRRHVLNDANDPKQTLNKFFIRSPRRPGRESPAELLRSQRSDNGMSVDEALLVMILAADLSGTLRHHQHYLRRRWLDIAANRRR